MDHLTQKIQTGQASQILGVSRKTVVRWAKAGDIPTAEAVGAKEAFVFERDAVIELAKARLASQKARLDRALDQSDVVAS